MVSATNPNNTNYQKPKNAYPVGGIEVEFPYQPYGSQLAFMCRVISTLDRAQRDGHCHALLESPTGTGKSLSLLCSVLAWQQNLKSKNQYANLSHSKPNPEAMTDPLAFGGGFVPESQPSTIPPSSNTETAQPAVANNKNQKKKTTPTIFYASKLLVGDGDAKCPEFKNVHKVKGHPSLQKGGCHEVHDIEDLVKVGQIVRGCSYYAARSMADDAQLVFCPYNYIVNPVIRGAMEVDIKGAIVILDEAQTLSPVNSFSSELGVQFGTCLEAPHVIDVESQVWASVISTGPGNYPLNASYKTADGYAFQDSLGKSLEEICNVVPGGSLVFFPSYKLMEKLCNRWRETGQWSRLNARKPLFVEPKGGRQEDFEHILKDYYESIYPGNKPAVRKKRRVKRVGVNHFNAMESHEDIKKEGAGLLAVCRGKVSEGIDFTDDNARVVIVVGIPFPNINDTQVALKKKYNDMYKSSKNLISGSEWYCHQAFRALNQAVDERFREERNRAYISKWLRKSIRQYDNFDMSLEGLKSFFRDVKERVDKSKANILQNSVSNEDNIPTIDQSKDLTIKDTQKLNPVTKCDVTFSQLKSQDHFKVQSLVQTEQDINSCKDYIDLECEEYNNDENNPTIDSRRGFTNKKNQKLNRFDHSEQKECSTIKHDAPSPKQKSLGDIEVQASVQVDKDVNGCKDYIDLECSCQNDLRCCEALSTPFSNEDLELSIVKETPCNTISPGSLSKDGNSSSTIFQASTQSPDQLSFHSGGVTNPGKVTSKTRSEMVVTPEKDASGNTCCLQLERDSSLSSSVNSHTQKRRKYIGSSSVDLNLMASREAHRRIEFGFETNYAEDKSRKSNISVSIAKNNSIASQVSSAPVMDKTLQISCSLCKSSLGLPENHLYVRCSLTSSSKVHLVSLLKERPEPTAANVPSIPVIMTDVTSINPRVCNRTLEGAPGQGIWCEEDGCVYNNIFCPFCITPKNCLGAQIVASDASNFHLLNKILLYLDHLEIRNLETEEDKSPKVKDSKPINRLGRDKLAAFNCIDKFSYSPQQENSGGWRTTASKLRLPKRGPPSN
ncbi:hypothetical protein LWI28_008889 [Acer negundo]|uniref:Helicase ATP-binding domain-containing protein n=1 Tax=Acer negundo TaxID=4023 RepID=A0AAD5P5J4_ACENE|nr:hypothetical protein LWI28_008889 [Acer negundo]